jgi:glucosamine--fructose-6-phosphate aminotransferase (isomerizing)
MCGIVGLVSEKDVSSRLIEGLRCLAYRGYDSAGISTIHDGVLDRRRAQGHLTRLEDLLRQEPLNGTIGIGHTRWATHGKPTVGNAHPHMAQGVCVVHNGIIENFANIKEQLAQKGHVCVSQTDTEVIAHLVSAYREEGLAPFPAVQKALGDLQGAFALAFLFDGHENLLVGVRHGAPLVVGYGEGTMYLASDALALVPFTNSVTYLEEGDIAVLTREGAVIYDASGAAVQRPIHHVPMTTSALEKGSYRHFMLKEIYEQPQVIGYTWAHYCNSFSREITLPSLSFAWSDVPHIAIVACGTAYYAGLVGQYWMERLAHLPTSVHIASEFRYRALCFPKGTVVLFVSQSGETADTLASLRYAKEKGYLTLAVVNVSTSTIAHEADFCFPTLAGTEVGVASTKAFTCQLTVLLSLALGAGRARGALDKEKEAYYVGLIHESLALLLTVLELDRDIARLARTVSKERNVLYLGRGTMYPLALEAALKLKEISYIHAEGYAAGELKHGPLALIDENVLVVALVVNDELLHKTLSNLQEVAARGGRMILFADASADLSSLKDFEDVVTVIPMPYVAPLVAPLIYAIPIQFLAYHTAVFLGKDVDQPRNLAKSVTVE